MPNFLLAHEIGRCQPYKKLCFIDFRNDNYSNHKNGGPYKSQEVPRGNLNEKHLKIKTIDLC